MLGRVEPEGPQDEQRRQQLLRAATELRAQLAAAKERWAPGVAGAGDAAEDACTGRCLRRPGGWLSGPQ